MMTPLDTMILDMGARAAFADGKLALLTPTGSRAYGTDTADSDHDFRGVYVASMERFCSLGGVKDTLHTMEPHDTTVYELNHFARLAAKGNPTALETLFHGTNYRTALGLRLIHSRDLFLSKRVRHTYGGYAISQLQKAKDGTGGTRGQDHHKRMKFKLHTLRLLGQGTQILRDGTLRVRLDPDERQWLMLAAQDSIEIVTRVAERMLKALDKAAETSSLPDEPDQDAIDRLIYDIRREA
jgi:predicted nucleotidyltransferase